MAISDNNNNDFDLNSQSEDLMDEPLSININNGNKHELLSLT